MWPVVLSLTTLLCCVCKISHLHCVCCSLGAPFGVGKISAVLRTSTRNFLENLRNNWQMCGFVVAYSKCLPSLNRTNDIIFLT